MIRIIEPYKIETASEHDAIVVSNQVKLLGGRAVRLGSAVLTDYHFDEDSSGYIAPLVTHTTGWLSPTDQSCWVEQATKTPIPFAC
ncbi:hypothetical protein [Vibrio sp. SCSIO 43136]|uniref:hypothetical protein n=1 Tax=Vibrio sp. SCSIO 43136 TaxID=2819101 RepID=UPI0020764380|nr:hypothetical protein [Vibrio sp. SCSIO 43136]USD63943.1 hypothetical protein J4N39_07325 [Vibrio sp. SCSIO 43136]